MTAARSQIQREFPRQKWAAAIAVLAVLFSFFFWTELLLLQKERSNQEAPAASHAAAREEGIDGFVEIGKVSIPKIGVDAPILRPDRTLWDSRNWEFLEWKMQDGLVKGTVAYPHSPQPGGTGNMIIAGHSSPPDARMAESPYANVFERLPELREGDVVSILTPEGGFVDYEVRGMRVVSPTETDVLAQPSKASVLTLITCYPIGTTKDRWVVTAERIDAGT